MSVVSTLGEIKKYFLGKSKADISTVVLKLHRWTAILLLTCSLLTSARQFFGDPIHCMLGGGSIPLPVFQSYCFMAGTYTLPIPIISSNITEVHPGVSTGFVHAGGWEDGTIYQNYYQWVCLILAVQACICYLPWAVWKGQENGIIGKLIVKVSQDPLTEVSLAEQVQGLAEFLLDHKGWFNTKASKLLICQVACLILTTTQLYLMDLVLGGQFLSLGNNVLEVELLSRSFHKIFPKVVMCSMAYIGPSGEPVNNSGLCTLPINIVNEKIYLMLWLWFLLLIVASVLCILLEFMLVFVPYTRHILLQRKSPRFTSTYLWSIIKRFNYGDIVLLQLISQNVDSSQFTALLTQMADQNALPNLQQSFLHESYGDNTGLLIKRGPGKDY